MQEMQDKTLPLILIVDDDEAIRDILHAILQDYARIITCSDAAEAIPLMEEKHPGLVLLDDKMPGELSGIDLLEKMQRNPVLNTTPVVLISANSDHKEVMRGLMAGAIDYILKPLKPQQVAEKIKARLLRLNMTILIADDDVMIRDLLEYKFRMTGYHVVLAEEGEQALSMMQQSPPDLAILDRMMSGYDGMTILQKMREDPRLKNVPVIFLTAKKSEADVMEGLNQGAADYIIKPFNPSEVVFRCMKVLNYSQASADEK
ncbi:MAG: response regulator [Alphaproteobacteria bacterium]|nr:response regulator [Alphaproteobacteria bacterium]